MVQAREWAIGLMLLTTVFTSLAQLFYKAGSAHLPDILTNLPLLAGMVCYGIAAVMMVLSFKGGDVSFLYPLLATSYIWVTVAAYFIYDEPVGVLKITGLVFILWGLVVMGVSHRREVAA